MMKKKMLLFIVPLLLSLSSCGSKTLDDGYLTVGLEAAYAPFNFTLTEKIDGAFPIANSGFLGIGKTYAFGYDILIADHVSSALDYQLQVRKISWEGLIPALTSGHIDAIIAGMTDTPARRESVSFSLPYYESELVMIVRSSSSFLEATSIDDFSGAKLAAQIGTVQNDLIIDYATDDGEDDDLYVPGLIAQTPYETYPDALLALLETNSGLDGVLAERPIATSMLEQYPTQIALVEFLDDEGNYDEDFIISVSIALRKADTQLLNRINGILENLSLEQRLALMERAVLASGDN